MDRSEVFFVTCMKDNARYEVIERRPVPRHCNILSDEIIRRTGANAQCKCPHLLAACATGSTIRSTPLLFYLCPDNLNWP